MPMYYGVSWLYIIQHQMKDWCGNSDGQFQNIIWEFHWKILMVNDVLHNLKLSTIQIQIKCNTAYINLLSFVDRWIEGQI
jgi:hypothetical protein